MIVAADRDAMYEASDRIKLIDKELRRIQYDVEQLVYSTCTGWQGDAERAFAEKLIFINEQFNDLHAFVDYYSEMLKRFADSYETLDEETAKKIKLI